MITGRGPGAPGVTPDMVYTLYQRATDDRDQAIDLGAIRRCDAIIDLLAHRRLLRPHGLHDPAVALLSALASDVDSPSGDVAAVPGALAAGLPPGTSMAGEPATGGRAAAGRPQAVPPARRPGVEQRAVTSWTRVAAAVAVAATVAGAATTGVLVTGMLARLARSGAGPAAGMRRGPGARYAGALAGVRPAPAPVRWPRR